MLFILFCTSNIIRLIRYLLNNIRSKDDVIPNRHQKNVEFIVLCLYLATVSVKSRLSANLYTKFPGITFFR